MGEVRKILICGLGGLVLELLGGLCLSLGLLRAAQVLAIYPGTLIFYVLPQATIDRLSDAALFWLWLVSGLVFWWVSLYLLCLLPKLGPSRTTINPAGPRQA
jgi:hypothetical protein